MRALAMYRRGRQLQADWIRSGRPRSPMFRKAVAVLDDFEAQLAGGGVGIAPLVLLPWALAFLGLGVGGYVLVKTSGTLTAQTERVITGGATIAIVAGVAFAAAMMAPRLATAYSESRKALVA